MQPTDLPSSIEIISKLRKWAQPIEFETLPFICFNYKKLGHLKKTHLINVKMSNGMEKKVWKAKRDPLEGDKSNETHANKGLRVEHCASMEGDDLLKKSDREVEQEEKEPEVMLEKKGEENTRAPDQMEVNSPSVDGKKDNNMRSILRKYLNPPF